jgi:hypothetical protein
MLENNDSKVKWANTGLKISVLLVFTYVLLRSILVGFTHDESLSYTILTGNQSQLFTANNHWLNTILMKCCSIIFGYSEWSLRLPNVLAFGLYAYSIIKILQLSKLHFLTIWVAFFVFFLNPFLLDFFGLARGYGLGMGFLTFAFYEGFRFFYLNQKTSNLILFLASSIACIYANYAFFTPILALQLSFFLLFLKLHVGVWKKMTIAYFIEICILIPAVLNIQYLSKMNELYAGGENNVFQDTLKSIFHFSYETTWFDFTFWGIWIFTAILIGSFFNMKSQYIKLILVWILVLILIPTALHYAIQMGFAKDRAAQYWILVGAFLTVFTFNKIILSKENQIIRMILIFTSSILIILNTIVFISHFNLNHSIIWKSDADVKNALQTIGKLNMKKGSKTLGISWTLEPSVNYYRETKSLYWLKPVNRDGISGAYDYYLFFDQDSNQLNQQKTIKIKRFASNKLNLRQSN